MIKSYIETYETYGTLETAVNLCQYLLDTDQVLPQYKTLCNYMLLEGCCYDVGYIIWLPIPVAVVVAILIPMFVGI